MQFPKLLVVLALFTTSALTARLGQDSPSTLIARAPTRAQFVQAYHAAETAAVTALHAAIALDHAAGVPPTAAQEQQMTTHLHTAFNQGHMYVLTKVLYNRREC